MPNDNTRIVNEIPLDLEIPHRSSDDSVLDEILSLGQDTVTPYSQVKLPSLGLYYDWNGIQSCEVRAMSRNVEKLMTRQDMAQDGTAIDQMLAYCCRFPVPTDPLDLLIGDRMYLMYYIRGLTHGNMYKFSTECGNCGQGGVYEFNLVDLHKTVIYADPKIKEPHDVVLPVYSERLGREITAGISFLRGRDLYNSLHEYKVQKSMVKGGGRVRAGNPKAETNDRAMMLDKISDDVTLKSIYSICGVHNPEKVRAIVDQMHSSDVEVIRAFLDQYMPSIDTTVTIQCDKCDKDFAVELPFTEYFFRPKKT